MKTYIILFAIILTSWSAQSQENEVESALINSLTGEVQLGMGGGNIGLMGRADHWWFEKGKFKLQSGVSLSLFLGSEKLEEGPSQVSGFNFDTHLQLHTGIEQSISKKERLYVLFDLYGGVYNAFTSGNYTNSELNIDRDYKNNDFIFDYGSRFGFGYRIKENWGLQLSMTNSWRAISEYGAIGLIVAQPDAKFNLGIGLNYRL